MTKKIIKPGLYRHYKNKDYEVLGLAFHHETEEPWVVYRAQEMTSLGNKAWFIRPFAEFVGFVTIKGRKVKRFRFQNK